VCAGKAASLEILSTNFLIEAHSMVSERVPVDKLLFFPLIACVKFCGVTVLCSSVLPIQGSDSLCYGTADGGKTIHNSNPYMNTMIDKIAGVLNLKEHLVGNVRVRLAADVEGHVGSDSRMYLIDTSRTFPPESIGCKKVTMRPKNSHLFRLLRPEFVREWDCNLSSDSFSGFQRADPLKKIHNLEVHNATVNLFDRRIPFIMKRLKVRKVYEAKIFCRDLHLFGVNVRHLGYMYELNQANDHDAEFENFLAVEIVSRCVKNLVRGKISQGARRNDMESLVQLHLRVLDEVKSDAKAIQSQISMNFNCTMELEKIRAILSSDDAKNRFYELLNMDHTDGGHAVAPKVKNLYIFKFFLGFKVLEETSGSLGVEASRQALSHYRDTLEDFASVTLLQNFGGKVFVSGFVFVFFFFFLVFQYSGDYGASEKAKGGNGHN
jgi:hypothetical protein